MADTEQLARRIEALERRVLDRPMTEAVSYSAG